jgi:hypothetical protein
VFKNGKLVFTENVSNLSALDSEMKTFFGTEDARLDHLAAMICTALMAPFDGKQESDVSVSQDLVDLDVGPTPTLASCSYRSICDTRSSPLPRGCVLQRLLTLQRHTEIADSDAKELSDKMMNNIEDVEGLHQLVMWHPNTKLEQALTQDEIEDIVQLQRFLLSVTAKDVSLLLTFREITDDDKEEDSGGLPSLKFSAVGGRSYRFMISVIDLDPKPVHRIPTWVSRKEDWLSAYFDSMEGNQDEDAGNEHLFEPFS